MADGRLIELYLSELGSELAVPRRLRARVIAETRDHLVLAAAHRCAGCTSDDAQRAAIASFGPANVVARCFADELAVNAAHRATASIVRVTVAFWVLLVLSSQVPSVRAASPFVDNPYNAIAFFAAQLALVCASLSWTRSLRHRDATALPAGKLRWILRSDTTALVVIGVSVCAGLVAAIRVHPASPSGWRDAVLVAVGAVGALAVAASGPLICAYARTRALATIADEPPAEGDDALGDFAAVLEGWAFRARSGRSWALILDGVERARRTSLACLLVAQLDFRRHPWRACWALALGTGAAVGLSRDITEGLPSLAQLPRAAVAAALVGGVEALVIIVCFLVLARFLGIRPPAPRRRAVDGEDGS